MNLKDIRKTIRGAAFLLLALLMGSGVVWAETLPPEEVLEPERTLEDVGSSHFASEHKVTSGDNMLNGLYERPFTSEEMIYQPDLDIVTVDQASDELFYYFTIHLYGMNMQGGG
jgi:hypothetical protein